MGVALIERAGLALSASTIGMNGWGVGTEGAGLNGVGSAWGRGLGWAGQTMGESHRNEWEGAGLERGGGALIKRAGLVRSVSAIGMNGGGGACGRGQGLHRVWDGRVQP